jgi:hypothetical protein
MRRREIVSKWRKKVDCPPYCGIRWRRMDLRCFLIPYFQVTSSSSTTTGGRGGREEGL